MATPPLADQLTSLGLHHTAAHLDDLIASVTKKRLAPLETIELLVERESQHRAARAGRTVFVQRVQLSTGKSHTTSHTTGAGTGPVGGG